MVLQNQGMLGIAFFEATAVIILLVLFLLFRRDQQASYFRFWLGGWCCLTFSSLSEVAVLIRKLPGLNLISVLAQAAALVLFLVAVVHCKAGSERRIWSPLPLIGLILVIIYSIERGGTQQVASLHWGTAVLESLICLVAGWLMLKSEMSGRSHGAQLLAGIFLLKGLHGMDYPLWPDSPLFLLRVAFDHFLGVGLGIAMVVVVLEAARTRSEELNDKMRRLTLLTAASTQTLSTQEVIDQVLWHLVESLGATHGIVQLKVAALAAKILGLQVIARVAERPRRIPGASRPSHDGSVDIKGADFDIPRPQFREALADENRDRIWLLARCTPCTQDAEPPITDPRLHPAGQGYFHKRLEVLCIPEKVSLADGQVFGESTDFAALAGDDGNSPLIRRKSVAPGFLHSPAQDITEEVQLGILEIQSEALSHCAAKGFNLRGGWSDDHETIS